MDRMCFKGSTSGYKSYKTASLVQLDVRINKEKIGGLQRVDIALSKSEKVGELGDSVPTYGIPRLYCEEAGNLFISGIEIEVYEKFLVSDAQMRVSEKLCFTKKDASGVELVTGVPYVHSLWVHSDKPLYALVTAKLVARREGYGDEVLYALFELSKVGAESEGVFDLKKG